ncbi:extracellular sulfatase Sulf-1-like isoform X4 [Ptychodera flava]|uniref:extracellular sulfatase Sulf-1-like isoform X4 n=1 Tax=Ptychodera flava TaxID=63121 RepID=UPI00396A0EE7
MLVQFSLLLRLLATASVVFMLSDGTEAAPDRNRYREKSSSRLLSPIRKVHKQKNRSTKPNIVVVLTDDQDVLLHSMDVMNKTRHILEEGGATFTNAFVTTPMCCPSRSTILTGLHTHNHEVFTNNEHCGSLSWRRGPETRTFAAYLQRNSYRTGYFGKYLNTYNGTYVPPGWMEWVGLVRNSRFYDYAINRNGNRIKHGNDYYNDYLTDLIANDSVTFFKLSKQVYPTRPVAIVLAMPAPHGPEDAAPQYQHMFSGVMTHRTATWNMAPNPDKHWIFQYTGKMTPQQIAFTDILQQKRLQTLLSVDDAIEKVYNMLKEMDELDNTFILFTSDHGYHAGQFGLVKGKSMPYDMDTRVPFYIRGPNVPAGIVIPNIVLNIDIAPTILDMAGVTIPQDMDGKSVLKLIFNGNGTRGRSNGKKKRHWRDTFLIERGRKEEVVYNSNYLPKDERMREECSKPEHQSPCQPGQLKECVDDNGKLRMKKCRQPRVKKERKKKKRRRCQCNRSSNSQLSKKEKKSQRQFLREHLSQVDYKPRFLKRTESTEEPIYELPDLPLADGSVRNAVEPDSKCQVYANETIVCSNEVFSSRKAWMTHRQFLSGQIEALQEQIKELKQVREFVKDRKPAKRRGKVCICEEEEEEEDDGSEEEIEGEPRFELVEEEDSEEIEATSDQQPGNKKDPTQNLSELEDNQEYLSRYAEKLQKKFDLTEEELDQKLQKKAKKLKRQRKQELHGSVQGEDDCNIQGLSCFFQHNDHWKTPPLWNLGSFCFCSNSVNNTYWCLRTINSTHNFLYCEFVTGFIEYFDMLEDPNQTKNVIHSVSEEIRRQFHEELMLQRECKGARECNPRPKLSAEERQAYGSNGQKDEKPDPERAWDGWIG